MAILLCLDLCFKYGAWATGACVCVCLREWTTNSQLRVRAACMSVCVCVVCVEEGRSSLSYLHTAVGQWERVSITGHALLLAVIGTGGGGQGVACVHVVGVNGLPPLAMPAHRSKHNTIRTGMDNTHLQIQNISWYPFITQLMIQMTKNCSKNGHIYYQQFYHGHTIWHNTYMALWYTTVEVHPYISIKITAVHLYLKPFNNTFIVQLNSFSKTRLGYTSFCPSQSQSQYTFTFLQVVFFLFCLCSYMTTSGQATWHKTGQQQLNETGQSASHTGRVKLSSGLCLEALWSY